MKKINFTLTNLKLALVVALGFFVSGSLVTAQDCTVNASASNLPLDMPEAGGGQYIGSAMVSGIPAGEALLEITIDLEISHVFASDLFISVTAPSGQNIVLFDRDCGSDDFESANLITYDDAGAAFICADPIAAQTAIPVDLLSTLVVANTSDLNGDWSIIVDDQFAGLDGGTYTSAVVNITTSGDCIPPSCDITCPTDLLVNLDPGDCCKQYNYQIDVADDCGSLPIEDFTGAFAPDNTEFEINTPTAAPGGNPPFQQPCGALSETEANMCSNDELGGGNTCAYIFTIYSWIVPENGTISFDWEYTTTDLLPAFDPFGTGFIAGGFIDLNALTDMFGPGQQSGSASIGVLAGDEWALYMQTIDEMGGEACVDVTNFVFTPNALLQINMLQGPESGACLDIGTTDFEVEIIAANGFTQTCEWSVEVIGFGNPTTTLACNDNVQVSVDENCYAIIGADMILEGGPYSCYDEYYVEVENYDGNFGSVMIDGYAVGQQLSVTISDPSTGNSCWGYINVEDKLAPMITCEDVIVPCGTDLTPVNTPPAQDNLVVEDEPGAPIMDATPFALTLDVPISAGALVDVNLTLDITHTWIGDLDVRLRNPAGQEVQIATNVCFAGGEQNWEDVRFDDEAGAVIGSACGGIPSATGDWRPEGNLSDLDGAAAAGTWTLLVWDGFFGDEGTVNSWGLELVYEELQLGYPTVSDNCGTPDLTYTDSESGDECDDLTVTRTWVATDASGNTASCEQIISIVPLDLSTLECPPAYEGDDCDDSIHPDYTGYPTVDGVEVDGGSVCNIFLDYWDKPLTACGNGTKIIRTWTILDWCTQEVEECVQVIKLPAEGPQLNCPADETVGSDPWFCYADVNLPHPGVYEPCGGSAYSLSVEASQGTIVSFGSYYRVDDLPLGDTYITWTAEDECGNSSTCSYVITVVDDVPPVAICDEHTIVALTISDNRITKVPAYTFDDGSYDNCGEVTFLARRMISCINFDWTTGGACIDDTPNGLWTSVDRGTAPLPCVPFTCCDVAAPGEHNPIMIELRVEDEAGNVNFCMIEIEVQDKLDPFLTPPPHVTVSCDFWFAVEETNGFVDQSLDPTTPVFGRVLDAYDYYESDRQYIVIDDPGNYQVSQPYNWGLEGWADDNCDVTITVQVEIFDDCSGDDLQQFGAPPYAVRLVRRTFNAEDGQGNSTSKRQMIWIVDFDPFYIKDETCYNSDRNDGVIWPCDQEYNNCPAGGVGVNYPTIFDDNCSLIGVTYEDTRFDFVDGACYKILREWTVIDWCQYESFPYEQGIWRYIQVIKVIDNDGPEITDSDAPRTYCVLDSNVSLPANNQVFLGENNPLASSCSAHVILEHSVVESCSEVVTYDVKVYLNDGSDYLQVLRKTDAYVDTNGNGTLTFDSRSSTLLGVRLNGLPYNSPYCANWPSSGGNKDYHRVLWSMEDGCGNSTTFEYLMRLEDCKAPSPVCLGLSSVVMPSSGEVTIWAADFNASSFDDCTPAYDLLYSFSGTNYEPSRSFSCESIEENGNPTFIVEIWVADRGNDQNCDGYRTPGQIEGITDGIAWSERNKDFCTTFIVIDDNEGVCPGGGSSAGGAIQTEEQDPVELVTVNLKDNNGNVVQTFTTDKDGLYRFINPLLDLDLEPVRNDDPMNGVSTLDLVKIQKHLLGIQDLGSPYKLIAADANNSQSVSAIDLVELRKLILGLYSELPNNSSWRFADGEYVFADPTNPWDFKEVIGIETLFAMGNDFVAMKIGDVNGTVAANANSIETRNVVGVLSFVAAEQSVETGQEVVVDVTSDNFNSIIGYQFTLRTEGLTLTDVEAGAIDMGAENFGVHKSALTASWHRTAPVTTEASDVLFTMTFTATQNGSLSEMLSMSSRLTAAEAYDGAEDVLDVALTFNNGTVITAGKDFALFQNSPNPFNGETVVAFTLPEAMEATMTVFDVTGKVVFSVEGDYVAGYNQVTISSNELSATGVMYYRLDADDFTATKKMVLID